MDEMDEADWDRSGDVPGMIAALRSRRPDNPSALDGLLHRYHLACCRRIWPLLPGDAIRRGIEVAERFLDGRASTKELAEAEYFAEGEYCLIIECDGDPARIGRWTAAIAAIPSRQLRRLVQATRSTEDLEPSAILKDAAWFAFYAILYDRLRPTTAAIEKYPQFLSAQLLRETVRNPFRQG